MKKFTLLLALLLCSVTSAMAQMTEADRLDRTDWTVNFSSYCQDGNNNNIYATCITDGNFSTYFHSNWGAGGGDPRGAVHGRNGDLLTTTPEYIIVDLGALKHINGIGYTTRSNGTTLVGNGALKYYKVYVSAEPFAAPAPASTNTAKQAVLSMENPVLDNTSSEGVAWNDASAELKLAFSEQATGRYIMLVFLGSHEAPNDNQPNRFANCTELYVYGEDIAYNGNYVLSNGDNKLNITANGNEVSVAATADENAASAWSITSSDAGYTVQNILTGLYLNEASGAWTLGNTAQALTITPSGTNAVISNEGNTFEVAGISAWTLTENAAQAEVAAVGHGKIQKALNIATTLGDEVGFTFEDALAVTDWNAHMTYLPFSGRYYRFEAPTRGKYLGVNSNNKPAGVDYNASDFTQIWQLVASGNGFKLCNPNMNTANIGYFDTPTGGDDRSEMVANGSAGVFYLHNNLMGTQSGNFYISFQENEQTGDKEEGQGNCNYINMEPDGLLSKWRSNDSKFIAHRVETIEVALATVGANTYASVCLPFAVTVGSDVKAYVGDGAVENNSLKIQEATEIAAEAGFIIEGTGASTTLTIGASDAAKPSSISGTFRSTSINDDNRANYLVFGKNASDEVGFYSMAASLTAIPANKAYLNVTSGNAVKLIFPGNVTGIESIDNGQLTMDNDAPIYDLSGRKVLAPAKGGIYVKGGKKYIVK